ncbi:MAG: hypothetical protein H0T79_17325 [Deltaproteobacteria bacterium]|nr:hypothetical protein [Deltaproteobacteria bacterium]
MSNYLIACVLTLAACGGKQQPTSQAAPSPSEPAAPMTPDACTAQGGQVRGDIGDGKIACAEGERELGRVSQGIEGAICCLAATKP